MQNGGCHMQYKMATMTYTPSGPHLLSPRGGLCCSWGVQKEEALVRRVARHWEHRLQDALSSYCSLIETFPSEAVALSRCQHSLACSLLGKRNARALWVPTQPVLVPSSFPKLLVLSWCHCSWAHHPLPQRMLCMLSGANTSGTWAQAGEGGKEGCAHSLGTHAA